MKTFSDYLVEKYGRSSINTGYKSDEDQSKWETTGHKGLVDSFGDSSGGVEVLKSDKPIKSVTSHHHSFDNGEPELKFHDRTSKNGYKDTKGAKIHNSMILPSGSIVVHKKDKNTGRIVASNSYHPQHGFVMWKPAPRNHGPGKRG